MYSHLIAVKICVESGGNQRVKLNGRAFDQQRLKGLNTKAVQGGRAIQHHRAILDDLLQHFPNFGAVALDQAAGTLYICGIIVQHQTGNYEWAEQFQRHALGQTALVELQVRADDDDGAARIVDALAEQVATEATLLALE